MAITGYSLGQRMDHINAMIKLTYYKHLHNNRMFTRLYSTATGSDLNRIEIHYGKSEVSITEMSHVKYLVEYFFWENGDRIPSHLRKPAIVDNPLYVINEIQMYIAD